MEVIRIHGGKPLCGSIAVQGAKNSALPVLAAAVISGEESIIHNCPDITDVRATLSILRSLGCETEFKDNTVTVNSRSLSSSRIPQDMMEAMRSSVIFAGALLARNGHAEISYPGGCRIGSRPIDLHISAFEKLGISIEEAHGHLICSGNAKSANIFLEFPSVGATENIMLAACRGSGVVTVTNAAREPEIADLQNFLNAMGANVRGAGSDVIEIHGVKSLRSCEHTVIPDRIAAATFMASAAVAGGKIELKNIVPSHISSFIAVMRECGASVAVSGNSLVISAPKYIRPVKMISTMPYPGFPTDAQSLMMSVMAFARGTGIIKENIFSSRFSHAAELARMGADISVADRIAVIRGSKKLTGAGVKAADLRSGAALCVASLGIDGETDISNIGYIDRGYERLEQKLAQLGADAERIELSE